MEENELMNDIDDFQQQDLQDTIQNPENPENSENQETDSFIASILKDRGIQDMSKIKFEEDGEVKEVNWKDLSVEDQLNIFNSSSTQPKEELDEEEIALINAIRTNRMSPSEYIQYLQQAGINFSVSLFLPTTTNTTSNLSFGSISAIFIVIRSAPPKLHLIKNTTLLFVCIIFSFLNNFCRDARNNHI